jgi:hypothetical protein
MPTTNPISAEDQAAMAELIENARANMSEEDLQAYSNALKAGAHAAIKTYLIKVGVGICIGLAAYAVIKKIMD